jgi:phosphomevalonate kinase
LAGFVAATLAFLAQNHGIALSGAHALNVAGALGGQKVGLGTSAAVTVATLRAVLASAQVSWAAADVAAAARLVHGAAQDPPGSGYDVTAIAHGGVIAYARTPDRAQVLSWPRDLFGAALFSGASASTSAALQRPSLPDARLDDIQRASDGLLQAWPGPVANTLIALESCQQASDAAARDDPTLTAPHIEAVRQAIAEYGAVTRTSGAGGGDCVLALSDDRDRITALAQAWQARGGHVVGHLPRDIAPSEE